MDISYKYIEYNDIKDEIFFGFDRYQVTERVKYVDNGIIKEKPVKFTEEWSNERLVKISKMIKDIVKNGGVLLMAYNNDLVVGFAALESNLFFGEYLNLDMIQVSNKYRHQGIGRTLFEMIEESASYLGAKKLYISAHPNVYTYKFYMSMGCCLAKKINQEIFEVEPLDIQLEKQLL